MKNTALLVWNLQKAAAQTRTGTGTVSVLAIFSLTVSSCIAFLVSGGTWMFYQRMRHPEGRIAKEIYQHEGMTDAAFLSSWFALAIVACAFIFPALFSLTAQAAVLGASGRERRLAALRLLGLSSGDITRMTVLETGLQAIIGIVLGFAISLLVAPVFTSLKFINTPVALEEILLPWWGYIAVAALIMMLALTAAFIGMQRVRVSPLGVAKREMPKALKWWRLAVAVAVFVASYIALNNMNIGTEFGAIIGVAAFIFFNIIMLGIFVPFVLQFAFRLAALLPGTSHFVAARRISTDSRKAWKRSSAIAFFGFIAGYIVISPMGNDDLSQMFKQEPEAGMIFADITTGALLTLIFGFIITGVSIFLGQVSEVYANADLTRSLQLIGVKRSFHSRVAIVEIMGPIVLVSLVGFFLGSALGFAMLGQAGDMNIPVRLATAGTFLGAGWAVTILAILAAEPLRAGVLNRAARRND